MRKYSIITIILTYLSAFTICHAQIRDFQTTRLLSTSGAGVGTILVNETSLLNPAPIVFIPISSFYYQKGSITLENKSESRSTGYSDGNSQMYLISDSSAGIKGTFSYQDQAENGFQRTRYTSSLASPIGKRTSMGVLYRYTIDNDGGEENTFHQGVLGVTHIYSKDLIIGAVLVDPFLSHKGDAKATVGIQYNISNNFIFILDGGTDYRNDSDKNGFTRAALQVNFFKDLFLRSGQFHDKMENLKGTSWGISWIGPRIGLEYAHKTSEMIHDNQGKLFSGEQFVESSLALSVIF